MAQVDACLKGAGGVCAGIAYYKFEFPPCIQDCNFSISALECYNILVACRIWCPIWSGQHILLYSDNWASVCSLNSGSAEDPLMRAVLREVWWLTAVFDVELVIRHRPGASMHMADALSRANLSAQHAHRLQELLKRLDVPQMEVPSRFLSPPMFI